MLDLKFIRENIELIKEGLRKKQVEVDIDYLLHLDKEKRDLLSQVEELRARQNQASQEIASAQGEDKKRKIREVKEVSTSLKSLEPKLRERAEELNNLLLKLPNLPDKSVPEGKDERENKIERKWGEPPKFTFKARDHLEIGESLNLIDVNRAAKVSGSRFYYLKGEAVLLEFALVFWVINLLRKEGFIPVVPPVLAKEEIFEGMGYLPDADKEMYKTTLDNLRLAATSEQTIGPMFKDEILGEESLPQRYAGFSSCFRREAGSYGQDVRGILRVHQFDKVEMFEFCRPEDSLKEHEFLVSSEEKIMQELKIPYQVVIMCSGDLGMPAAKKYDLEAWLPGQNRYRETHSCSNCTDFQARRLNIRYRRQEDKKVLFVHTLNGTACAIGRTLIAILENYQQEDGSIVIPEVLREYMGGMREIKYKKHN